MSIDTAPADLTDLARELYRLPVDRFTATRDDLARRAARAGEYGLAQSLRRLRRPSLGAWLVNLLAYHEAADLDSLAALGRQLRDAQMEPDPPRLRALTEDRRELIGALLRRAQRHAAAEGVAVPVKALREAEATLRAAVADLGAAKAVQAGQLVRPMAHHGFGPLPSPRPPAAPPASMTPAIAAPAAASPAAGPDPWSFWPVGAPAPDAAPPAPLGPSRPDVDRIRPALALAVPHPAAEPTPSLDPTVEALADAEARHWRCEQELLAAEQAAASARDEAQWFDRQRALARQERRAAQRRLADAEAAQRSSVRALARARRAHEADR